MALNPLLHVVHPLLVHVQLFLQLRNHLRALLILLLEHGLDPLHLLLVSVGGQLQVLVHVIVPQLLLRPDQIPHPHDLVAEVLQHGVRFGVERAAVGFVLLGLGGTVGNERRRVQIRNVWIVRQVGQQGGGIVQKTGVLHGFEGVALGELGGALVTGRTRMGRYTIVTLD